LLRYKFFWHGRKDSNTGVGFLISRRWTDKVLDDKRVKYVHYVYEGLDW